MHVGIAVPQSWDTPDHSMTSLRRFIRAAEDGGLDSLWVQEQLIGNDPSFEPLSTLAFAAAITSRIRLAAAGFVAPLRPALGLAKALATIDQFSLGRLEAGFVIGEMPAAYSAGNVDWSSRGARFEDALAVIRSLWRDGVTDHESSFGTYRGVRITPKPVQAGGPPIWIGAKRRPALDRVARWADGWMGAGGASVAEWRRSLAVLNECCDERGRHGLRVGKKLYLWIDDDEERALERLGRWFAVHWQVADGRAMARRIGMWGAPNRVSETLVQLATAGADTIVLNPVGDELRHLDVICDKVLPEVR